LTLAPAVLLAQAAGEPAAKPPTPAELAAAEMSTPKVVADTLWVMITAMLVFWMNAGFACVETGLCRRKNAVNILSKNFVVFAISTVAFWVVGFGLMFGDGSAYIGQSGFLPALLPGNADVDLSPLAGDKYAGIFDALSWATVPLAAKFFFQLVFAGTAATIVSGAVAERIKYGTFLVFSFFIVAVIYAVPGHWIWGGGWLAAQGFWDFAGSTVVHTCGGWAALAGIIVLGPRLGKYRKDGGANPIPGHNMGLAALGCLILWLGWFGFNPGSTMAADPVNIGHIALTTNMAAATGAIAATFTAWLLFKKPDLSMTLNGCLAGLVAITAPCAWVTIGGAFWIGAVGGVIVVLGVVGFDKIKIDDPVGALSVHLLNGIFGTLAVGLFASPDAPLMVAGMGKTAPAAGLFYGGGFGQLVTQATGVLAAGGYVFVVSLAVWFVLKMTLGVRVSAAEEIEGLDLGEHGMEAYPGFAKEEGRDPLTSGVVAPGMAAQAAAEFAAGAKALAAKS
jgi:Amt family ammonium transporter